MKLLRILCLAVGGFLVLDTLIVCFLSNYNLGVILPAVLGLPLLLLGLLWGRMDAGFWLFLRRLVLVCYGLGCLFLLFLGSLMLRAIDRGEHEDYDALIVLGAAVYGVFYLIGFYTDSTQLMTAAGCAAAGIIFLSWPRLIVDLFPILAGVALILNGMSNLAEAGRTKEKGTAVTAVLVIIAGILIAFHPGFIANAIVLCVGIGLTLNGAFDLMMLYKARDELR